MSKIRDSARGETCTFMLPGVCSYNNEKVVYCHGPHPDRGTGYKSHPASEFWGAYGCYECHAVMDNLADKYWQHCTSARDYNYTNWFTAIRETQRRLIAKGLMPK